MLKLLALWCLAIAINGSSMAMADGTDTLDPLPVWGNGAFQRDAAGYIRWGGWHRLDRNNRDSLLLGGKVHTRLDDLGYQVIRAGPHSSNEDVRMLAWGEETPSSSQPVADSLRSRAEVLAWVAFVDSLGGKRWALLLLDGEDLLRASYARWTLMTSRKIEITNGDVGSAPHTSDPNDRIRSWPVRIFDAPPTTKDVVQYMRDVFPPGSNSASSSLLGSSRYADAVESGIVIRARTWRTLVGDPPVSLFRER